MISGIARFFKDKDGKVVIVQRPNLWLGGWLLFTLLRHLPLGHTLQQIAGYISTAFIVIWALLEIARGASPFRRLLGGVVLLATIWAYFG